MMAQLIVDETTITRMAEMGLNRSQITRIFNCSYATLKKITPEPVLKVMIVNGAKKKSRYKRCPCCKVPV